MQSSPNYKLEFTKTHIKQTFIPQPKRTTQHDNQQNHNKDQFQLRIKIDQIYSHKIGKEKILRFSLYNATPAIAVLLRRTICNDTTAVAIEKVGVYFNNSILSDETLSHRLGLLPIAVDPSLLSKCSGEMDSLNTLVFKLDVECKKKEGLSDEELSLLPASERFINGTVTSGDLQWVPQKNQKEHFGEDGVALLHGDVLLAKLSPGQRIMLEAFAQVGTADDHAKFSNVNTAHYKLKPKIRVGEGCAGRWKDEIEAACPPGSVEFVGDEVVFLDEEACAFARNVLQVGGGVFEVESSENDFSFEIESVGVKEPEGLVLESLSIIREKCESFLQNLDELNKSFSDLFFCFLVMRN